jgi:Right handed beta helix region
VRDGVYSSSGCSGAIVCVTRGGTASAPVTFRSERKWGARLDGGNAIADGFKLQANYVRIEGFEITRFASHSGAHGVAAWSGGANSRIIGNQIHHIGRICTRTSNGESAIILNQSNVTVEGNYIHDIGRFAPGEQGCSDAWGHENHDHGIYLDGNGQGAVIRGNYFARHERGWAIHIYPGSWDGVAVENNTFVHGNPYRAQSHIVVSSATLRNSRFSDNTFYDPDGGGAIRYSSATFSNVQMSGNRTDQPRMFEPAATPSGVTLSGNVVNAPIAEPPPP